MAKNGNLGTQSKPLNRSLSAAKRAKQDEFYTQYVDIQKEVEADLEFDANGFKQDTFGEKIVYCNCDRVGEASRDPFESNFFKSFAANFNKLGLKRLICTSNDVEGIWGSPLAGQMTLFDEYNEGNGHRKKPKAIAVIADHVTDENNDGAADIEDVKLFLKRNKANRSACGLRRALGRANGSRLLQRGRWHGAQPAISFMFTGPPK